MRIEAESKFIPVAGEMVSIEVTVKHVALLGGSEQAYAFGPFIAAPAALVKKCVGKAISNFMDKL